MAWIEKQQPKAQQKSIPVEPLIATPEIDMVREEFMADRTWDSLILQT
jgi:hypothetical protein